ncbi:MAG: type II toxin-antitoxin system RelE/ParE family toxin [Chloroflexi bacterium]|nr:type II toxin-antitoxin system RelE/ParE family toxin [Chloroflexota bacterium]
MARYRLTREAEADIESIASWSEARFGRESRRRYIALLVAAFLDVTEDPTRIGHVARPELGEGIRSWHLRGSRHHSTGRAVRQPRHILIYRVDGDVIEIVRVLHDAMDPRRHLDPDEAREE